MHDPETQAKGSAFFQMLPYRFVGPAAVLAFIAIALLRWDLVTGVEFLRAEVVAVHPAAGKDALHRLVVVQGEGWQRALYTSDPYIFAVKGGKACVSKRRLLLRQWQRYALELPGYCRNIKPLPQSLLLLPATGPKIGARSP